MTSIDLDDDLIIFTTDSFDDLKYDSCTTSDSSTSSPQSNTMSSIQSVNKKMSDITDLLDSADLHDNSELISTNIMDYLRTHNLQNEQDTHERYKWESEEKCLQYGKGKCLDHVVISSDFRLGSKQLSPNDYLTRTSLYNRPVAFEKDSRSWARSLLDNFKKSNQNLPSTSSSTSFPSYFPIIKKSSSFDHHVQYIEHLNECNDYAAYLEYLRDNRSQLFCTLTDSIDVIDGLLGTVVSSF